MRYFLFLLCCMLIYLCNSCQSTKSKREIIHIVKNLFNKEIIMPDSIFVIKDGTPVLLGNNPLYCKKFKILTLIPADCEKCIYGAKSWCAFLDTINKISSIDFIPVFITSNPGYFIEYYIPRLPKCINPYLDILNKFIFLYNFPSDWNLRTFLLDENNKILLIGNPIYNQKIKNLYYIKIKENG